MHGKKIRTFIHNLKSQCLAHFLLMVFCVRDRKKTSDTAWWLQAEHLKKSIITHRYEIETVADSMKFNKQSKRFGFLLFTSNIVCLRKFNL